MSSSKKNSADTQVFKNGKNLVLYSVFLECCSYTNDEFWKDIFEQLSYGKCPSCIYISGNTIYASNKKKPFSYVIPIKGDSQDVFIELKELLMTHTALCSIADNKAKQKTVNPKDKDDITNKTSWTEIRKKNIREIFLIKFVLRMRSKHQLSWDAARELYSLIQIGLLTKIQISKDVHFSMKRIQSIDGIEYDGNGRFVNRYSNNEIPKEIDEIEDYDNYLYYYWDKYVSSISKTV